MNPEEFIFIEEGVADLSRAGGFAGLIDLCKPASTALSAASKFSEGTGLLAGVGRSNSAVEGLANLELTGHASENLALNVSHLDHIQPSASLSASSLNDMRAAIQANPTGSALQALSQHLAGKGLTSPDIDQAMTTLSQADLNPRAMRMLSDAVKGSGNPARLLNETADWLDSDSLIPDALRRTSQGRANAFFVPGSESQSALQDIAVAAARSGKLTDDLASRITGLAGQFNRGEVILANPESPAYVDAYSAAKGIVNPRGGSDICTSCTSAAMNNLKLGTSDIMDRISQAIAANKSGYYDTALVPVVDGAPQMTAEHIQSLHGFAGEAAGFPSELRGLEPIPLPKVTLGSALQRGNRYVADATGMSPVPFATVPGLADGAYPLNANILDLDGKIVEPHSMFVVKEGGQLTFFDPLNGTSSQDLSRLSSRYQLR